MIFLDEELAAHLVGGVFHQQFVFVACENDANRRVVALGIFLVSEVAEVEIHLADVVVLDFFELQIDQNKTAENAVVENQIDAVVGVIDRYPILPTDKGEAFAEFQQEWLEVVANAGLELGFVDRVGLRDFEELEDERIAEEVGRFFHSVPLIGQLQDLLLVLAGSEPQEERRFLLALEVPDTPSLPQGFLLVKASFQGILDL